MSITLDTILVATKAKLEALYPGANNCGQLVRSWNIMPAGHKAMMARMSTFVSAPMNSSKHRIELYAARFMPAVYDDYLHVLRQVLTHDLPEPITEFMMALVRPLGGLPEPLNLANPDINDSIEYRDDVARGFCRELVDCIQLVYPIHSRRTNGSGGPYDEHYLPALHKEFFDRTDGHRVYLSGDTIRLIKDYATERYWVSNTELNHILLSIRTKGF